MDQKIDPGAEAARRAGYGRVYEQAYSRARQLIIGKADLTEVSAGPVAIFR